MIKNKEGQAEEKTEEGKGRQKAKGFGSQEERTSEAVGGETDLYSTRQFNYKQILCFGEAKGGKEL